MNILEYSSGQYQQAISSYSKLLKYLEYTGSQKLDISRSSKLYFPAGSIKCHILLFKNELNYALFSAHIGSVNNYHNSYLILIKRAKLKNNETLKFFWVL